MRVAIVTETHLPEGMVVYGGDWEGAVAASLIFHEYQRPDKYPNPALPNHISF